MAEDFDIMTVELPSVELADLTTKSTETGAFDAIMASVYSHLGGEFEKGRITGADYTKAYIELTAAVLTTSVQFLLGKDAAYWQAILIRQQAINAEAQNALILEQTEVQRAQTLDTRSDGITAVVGAIGKQKALYTQQITSYQRDSEIKVAKLYSDAWITQKTLDEGLLAPTQFTNTEVNEVIAAVRLANSLGS